LRIHRAFFIYNPYSIVNERSIAEIDAERNHLIALTVDSREQTPAVWWS
jgi:predicted lactoylglutathione lyase